MGIVEGTGPVRSVFGVNSVYREMRVIRREGVTMLLNVVLTAGKPTPKSNFRDGN